MSIAFIRKTSACLPPGIPGFCRVPRSACSRCSLEPESATTGKHVVIVGRSNIVGKPLALILLQKPSASFPEAGDATVTVAHSRTADLPAIARTADILVAAVGVPRFVTGEMVKPGAAVIDVGINSVGGKLVGDVDEASVAPVAGWLSPVPKGVGPMTITMLLHNTLRAAMMG